MKIVVTGAYGFIGNHVVKQLISSGHDLWPPLPRAVCDLRNPDTTMQTFLAMAPDCVIHLAANVGGIGYNLANPADLLRDNALMGINVIHACAAVGVPHVVNVGTTCSYPGDAKTPINEEQLWDGYPDPSNAAYGIAKRMVIEYGNACRRQHGINVTNLILANVYGPGDDDDLSTSHVIPAIIRKMQESKDIVKLWGDGTPKRDFLYVADAARAIVKAVDCDRIFPINVGSGKQYTIAETADIIASVVGYTGAIEWSDDTENGQMERLLDTYPAEDILDFFASVSLREGIERCVR